MGLADIASVPTTDHELKKWAFCHMAVHRDIVRITLQKANFVLREFDISSIDPDHNDVWQYQHQIMHSEMNAVFGVAGNDLFGVNWRSPDILKAWIFLHLPEHMKVASALGL